MSDNTFRLITIFIWCLNAYITNRFISGFNGDVSVDGSVNASVDSSFDASVDALVDWKQKVTWEFTFCID